MKERKKRRKKVVVTAGPTIEPIDPVRFISNFSTGTMGYAIARKAAKKGHETLLISGPVGLVPPPGVVFVRVNTAKEMRKEVMSRCRNADCLIMAAAVCDFRPLKRSAKKIKKSKNTTLWLVENPDILKEVKHTKGLIKAGFALETGNIKANALEKMKKKGLDLIVANVKNKKNDPFGQGEKDFLIIDREGKIRKLRRASKEQCAAVILSKVERMMK